MTGMGPRWCWICRPVARRSRFSTVPPFSGALGSNYLFLSGHEARRQRCAPDGSRCPRSPSGAAGVARPSVAVLLLRGLPDRLSDGVEHWRFLPSGYVVRFATLVFRRDGCGHGPPSARGTGFRLASRARDRTLASRTIQFQRWDGSIALGDDRFPGQSGDVGQRRVVHRGAAGRPPLFQQERGSLAD